MPSTALAGKYNEEADCDLMFYTQGHNIYHLIDRCIPYATGIEILDKTMTILKAKGTDLRIRARGRHATTIEALLHVMEAELSILEDIPLVFTRLLHGALFAAHAFTFYSEVSPCNALFGRQPAMLPDLPVLDREQPTETSDHSREQTIRRVCIEAITKATTVTKTNRASRARATITGQHYYDEGDL
eukprot:3531740-Pyramimonas_sp.AAC.1